MARNSLKMWTVYSNPSDYPGKFVVREWESAGDGSLLVKQVPLAVVDTLEEARVAVCQAAPIQLTVLPRSPNDDPVIVEVWL